MTMAGCTPDIADEIVHLRKRRVLKDHGRSPLSFVISLPVTCPTESQARHTPCENGNRKYDIDEDWQSHWVQCDACLLWRKITEQEHVQYADGASQCTFFRLSCARQKPWR